MKIRVTFVLFCAVMMVSGCALRRDVVYLNDRIDALEKKIAVQKSSLDESDKALRLEFAKLSNDLEKLSEQIHQVDGKADEKLYAFEKKSVSSATLKSEMDRFHSLVEGLTLRLSNLEKYTAFDSEPVTNKVGAVSGDSASPSGKDVSPEIRLYNAAQAAIEKNDMKAARENLIALIKKFPNSNNADNAQFWIGETYYREKWYQKAILEYQKVIENYPKGNKVSAAYFKQGLAFFELGEAENGKLILNQLIKKFPDSGEASIAKKKLGK